jgi:hypothetical protein
MEINVELAGQLLPGVPRHQTLYFDKPVTVREVALLLGLDAEEVGLIVVNGIQSEMDDDVPPESRLSIFPYLSGG